jgi:NAD(P)-dependent dehydrogenase (short-subunit alcohol dehydrogenase family)
LGPVGGSNQLSSRAKIECGADVATMANSAIVTGGTGGLGAAVVARLLDDGWRVVVPWIVERELERVAERPGLELIRADLFEAGATAEVAAAGAGDPAAPLRGLVNLVGGFAVGGRVHEAPIEEFDQQLRLNLRPTYLVTQAVIPHLLDNVPPARGSIVCVGSRAALQPFSGAAGYVTAKAAVIAFAQAVAAEYRADGIRCNAILPSVIDTPANRAAMPKADHARWVAPAEIAGVIAHLLSADAAPTSGAAIPVYGRA